MHDLSEFEPPPPRTWRHLAPPIMSIQKSGVYLSASAAVALGLQPKGRANLLRRGTVFAMVPCENGRYSFTKTGNRGGGLQCNCRTLAGWAGFIGKATLVVEDGVGYADFSEVAERAAKTGGEQ